MKQLKFKFDLSSKVSIYVPTTVNVNEPVDNSEQVKRAMTALCGMFGGATASDARGGWVSPGAGLVIEAVTIVYAYCKEAELAEHFDEIVAMCEELKDEMKQDAISLEINGQLAFI